MNTDTSPKEGPAGSANYPAGHTDTVIVPNEDRVDKTFSFPRVQFALHGHTVYGPSDGRYVVHGYLIASDGVTKVDAERYACRHGPLQHHFGAGRSRGISAAPSKLLVLTALPVGETAEAHPEGLGRALEPLERVSVDIAHPDALARAVEALATQPETLRDCAGSCKNVCNAGMH